MRWLKAYLNKVDGKAAACPECGSDRVEFRRIGDPATRVGWVVVWCGSCRKGGHISRAGFPEGAELVSIHDEQATIRGIEDIEIVD